MGLPIVHETHRRRLFWNPFNFRDILKGQEDLKEIKINLDVSLWVVCLERIFDSPESHQVGLEQLSGPPILPSSDITMPSGGAGCRGCRCDRGPAYLRGMRLWE